MMTMTRRQRQLWLEIDSSSEVDFANYYNWKKYSTPFKKKSTN